MGESRLTTSTKVYIDEYPDLGSDVIEIWESLITARFEQSVDLSRIPQFPGEAPGSGDEGPGVVRLRAG
jgi:hypothetical protein